MSKGKHSNLILGFRRGYWTGIGRVLETYFNLFYILHKKYKIYSKPNLLLLIVRQSGLHYFFDFTTAFGFLVDATPPSALVLVPFPSSLPERSVNFLYSSSNSTKSSCHRF